MKKNVLILIFCVGFSFLSWTQIDVNVKVHSSIWTDPRIYYWTDDSSNSSNQGFQIFMTHTGDDEAYSWHHATIPTEGVYGFQFFNAATDGSWSAYSKKLSLPETEMCYTISPIYNCNAFIIPCNDDLQAYYAELEGKSGNELRNALHNIITRQHQVVTYAELRFAYQATDRQADGSIWDFYSSCGGSYFEPDSSDLNPECGCFNREHSLPKSWWWHSDSDIQPMYSDIVHVIPTNCSVNSIRGAYPYGEVDQPLQTTENGSKYGYSSYSGYSGLSFEPIDTYKGDLARNYFYMAVCYGDVNFTRFSDGGGAVFTYNNNQCDFTEYGKNLFMDWHRNDYVGEKERVRNDGVQSVQGNRNPFIDLPHLAEYLWGNKQNQAFCYNEEDCDELPIEDCQNIQYTQNFSGTLGDFTEYNVLGYQNWYGNASYGAKISGHTTEGDFENEDWLISPTFNLTDMYSVSLTFDHVINFCTNENDKLTNHTLWVSTNYQSGDPNLSDWTALTIPIMPDGNSWDWANSGTISFPDSLKQSNVHFAFKYISNTSVASTWQIKNLIFNGECNAPSWISDNTKLTKRNKVYTRGNEIYIENVESMPIAIYDLVGRVVYALPNVQQTTIPISTAGLYIVRIGNESHKVIIRK